MLSGKYVARARLVEAHQKGCIPWRHRPSILVPCIALGSEEPAPKPKRARKKPASSKQESSKGVAPAADVAASSVHRSAADIAASSLQRLHSGSDALRTLLERRAERQKKERGTMTSTLQTGMASADLSRPFFPAQEAGTLHQKRMAKVQFWIQFHVEFGQSICLVGSSAELGKWILSDGVPLTWSEGDMWSTMVEIPAGSVVEYKYVVVGPGGHAAAWQQGNNSVLALRHVDDAIEVFDNWYNSPGSQVIPANSAPVTRENRLLSWATEIEAQVSTQRQELRRVRMELVAAQEEARIAREEARQLKAALAQSEAQRLSAVTNLKHAEMVNQVLQSQLSETMTSFRQAVEVAVKLLESTATQRQSKTRKVEGLDDDEQVDPPKTNHEDAVLPSVVKAGGRSSRRNSE